jgi:hypothetical protein
LQKKALEILEKRIQSHLVQSADLKNQIIAIKNARLQIGQERTKYDIERINDEIVQLINEKAILEKKLVQRKFSFFTS